METPGLWHVSDLQREGGVHWGLLIPSQGSQSHQEIRTPISRLRLRVWVPRPLAGAGFGTGLALVTSQLINVLHVQPHVPNPLDNWSLLVVPLLYPNQILSLQASPAQTKGHSWSCRSPGPGIDRVSGGCTPISQKASGETPLVVPQALCVTHTRSLLPPG